VIADGEADWQTVFGPPGVTVGAAVIVMEKLTPVLEHPPLLVRTVKVPVYVPAAAAAGTVSTIGLAGNGVVFGTLAKPADIAAALYTIPY